MKNKLIVCLLCGLMSVSFTAAKKPGFAVWQLCAQGPSQMNSYVFVTDRGRVVVLDGGTAADAPFLRGFVAALGNRVDKWIVTHPHVDHMGALTEILKDPRQMIIDTVYQSPMTDEQLRTDMNRKKLADAYYEALRDSGLPVVNLTEPPAFCRRFPKAPGLRHRNIPGAKYPLFPEAADAALPAVESFLSGRACGLMRECLAGR